jgi:hypothetical protein
MGTGGGQSELVPKEALFGNANRAALGVVLGYGPDFSSRVGQARVRSW